MLFHIITRHFPQFLYSNKIVFASRVQLSKMDPLTIPVVQYCSLQGPMVQFDEMSFNGNCLIYDILLSIDLNFAVLYIGPQNKQFRNGLFPLEDKYVLI